MIQKKHIALMKMMIVIVILDNQLIASAGFSNTDQHLLWIRKMKNYFRKTIHFFKDIRKE